MPTILTALGLRFFFYANDHEPIHVHVSPRRGKRPQAKINIHPDIEIISNQGFSEKEMRAILKIVIDNRDIIIENWKQFFDEDKSDA